MKKKKLKKIIRAELSRIVKALVEVMRSKRPSVTTEQLDELIKKNLLEDIAKAFQSDVSFDKFFFEGPPVTGKITNLSITGLDKPKKTRKRRTA